MSLIGSGQKLLQLIRHSLLWLILVLLFLPSILFAQDFKAGARLGICATQVDGDTYEGFNKPGLTLGVFVNRKLEADQLREEERKKQSNINALYVE